MMKPNKCFFNMDTGCVELHCTDGGVISIHCTRLENEIANNMYEQAELDWLIYNELLTYLNLVLSSEIETHIKGHPEHSLQD